MPDTRDIISVERVIPSPSEPIFALLADPTRHQSFDGSGTVRDAKVPGGRVGLGDTFGMSMKAGIPYSMVNEIIEYEENRRIAWQTRGPGPLGKLVGGRIWRYELEPLGDGTLVRESWDISQEKAGSKPFVRKLADMTRKNMAATLERIEQAVTTGEGDTDTDAG
ncbi:MAG: SRPBCC family protein [Acidimicrobiia bacterium]|nr:SRPBCC family protein [Acidimicrobiia bacterium]